MNTDFETVEIKFNSLLDELFISNKAYRTGATESNLTDEEYDLKEKKLIEIGEMYPFLQTDKYKKLVHAVGGESLNSGSSKITHNVPMLSLAKANSIGEIEAFIKKTSEAGALEDGWIVQAKLDGTSISAIYENGKLVTLATRGNGNVGEDITFQINYIKAGIRFIDGLPLEISTELNGAAGTGAAGTGAAGTGSSFAGFTGEVRGELFMTDEQFEKTNAIIESNNLENAGSSQTSIFKNSRNAVAGISRSEKSRTVAYMTFFAFGKVGSESAKEVFELRKLGFKDVISETAKLFDQNFSGEFNELPT
ncbi:MAG: hypothetical protein LBN03_01915, partial [Bifidobacteriaceae bacterium]|nr:hypothetical protein [Bifidobacteriaceae bacterium]